MVVAAVMQWRMHDGMFWIVLTVLVACYGGFLTVRDRLWRLYLP